MKCFCYETESALILCVENVEKKYKDTIRAAYFQEIDHTFIKTFPKDANGKELVEKNFPVLGEAMFKSESDWKKALLVFAEKCSCSQVAWYITGSVSEALIGVNINPHDIDIVIHTKDFYRLKNLFSDFVVEPFSDLKDTWVVRFFSRLCINGVMIDIASDESRNFENHEYSSVSWNGYEIFAEPLHVRYQIELSRNRTDRIKAIEEYRNHTK